jgi:RNA recognition motif-containing protein
MKIMKIYLFNLSENITADALEIILAARGKVVSASVVPTKNSFDRHAIIQMASEEDAHAAMTWLNGSIIDGQVIKAWVMTQK